MAITDDILRSWRDPKAAIRTQLGRERSEGRAVTFLMTACLLIFLAQWPRLARIAQEEPEIPFQGLLGGALMAWLFIAPILLYGLAGLLQAASRLLRRPIDGYAARLSLFWALLAASPLWLFYGLVAALAGSGAVRTAIGFVILIAFFWLLGRMLGAAALEADPPSA